MNSNRNSNVKFISNSNCHLLFHKFPRKVTVTNWKVWEIWKIRRQTHAAAESIGDKRIINNQLAFLCAKIRKNIIEQRLYSSNALQFKQKTSAKFEQISSKFVEIEEIEEIYKLPDGINCSQRNQSITAQNNSVNVQNSLNT